ncbi:MAG TPA: ABC transporter substrate-binding protein [Acidimicrobiales bacterium]|nr:ABC transporter substrate-binding protein [Acidimicrobiales bacterium]
MAAILALSLLAAGCGSDNKSSSDGGGASVSTETPKAGGKLVMGVEAEVDGFDPTQNRMDVTGLTYASIVYDSLGTFGKDGKVHPYLAESIDHNADYSVWTVKLRPNVKFSNGDPLTADDVVADWTAHLKSPLTSPAIAGYLKSVTKVDDLTAQFTMAGPWVPFPSYLTGQLGFVFSHKMLDDPKNAPRNPIGTGPFILKEWVPGNHMIATKNPNYWQKGLPYLDSVELRPIVETQSRESSLKAGTIDLMHSSDVQTIKDLKGNGSIASITDEKVAGEGEEHFIMLNTAKAPLDDVRVRQALAYATDRKRVNDTIDFGLTPDSTGPFGNVGSAFHGDTGYPSFSLQKAKDLVAAYEKDKGVNTISFELGTTNTGRNLQDMSLIQSMWKDAGINVTIKQVQQSEYILNALNGAYDAYDWRQFGEPDPDADFVWWTSKTASPIGQLALNFARNKDPQVDADLLKGRTSPNDADRKAAYEDIAKQFGTKDFPYLWLGETAWQIAFKPKVKGVTNWTLPDGAAGVDHTIGGFFLLTHVGVN